MTFAHWLMREPESRRLILRQYMHKKTKCKRAEDTVNWCTEMHTCPRAGTGEGDSTPLLHEQHATVNYRCSVARPQGVITWKIQLCFASTCQAAQRTICQPADLEFCVTIFLFNAAWRLKEWKETASAAVLVLAPDCVISVSFSQQRHFSLCFVMHQSILRVQL